MDRCTGCCDITEIQLKMALNTIQQYSLLLEAPRITSFESMTLVAAGDDAELFCGAVGIPQPTIKWYKGEVEVNLCEFYVT